MKYRLTAVAAAICVAVFVCVSVEAAIAYEPAALALAAGGKTGDFNGDHVVDIVAQYDYGGTKTGLWVFVSNSYGVFDTRFEPQLWWYGTKYSAAISQIVVGEFNGDGVRDIVAQYDYGGTRTGLWVFASDGDSFHPQLWWYGTKYSAANSQITAADFDADGVDDIVAQYDYGGTKTGLWVFASDGDSFHPQRWWYGTKYSAANSQITAADFDGNGIEDIVAQYNYGGTKTGLWVFASNALTGSWTFTPQRWWYGTKYSAANSQITAGDFNYDGMVDIGAQYNYGGTTTGMFIFWSKGYGFIPFRSWYGTKYSAARSQIG
ncbi:MAG: VCBS repeat-containing protein [Coriobacteriia bacterium]|nr:VCBS repeat-containing protein [Coriobacteriia bacterium]